MAEKTMQGKCTQLYLLRQLHVLQGFVPATSREKERMTDVSPLPYFKQKPNRVNLQVNERAK